jgi:hypothetical protein
MKRIPNTSILLRYSMLLALSTTGCGSDNSEGEPSEDSNATGGSVQVQISGEELATDGFLFPDGSEVAIADGWEIEFSRVLVTVGRITLSTDPNRDPSDQSKTGGVVAEANGPWAIDVHQEGDETGAGGEGSAILLTTLTKQNKNGNAPFEADREYAFGYQVQTASEDAKVVNFAGDAEAEAAYAEMVEQGYTVLYMGTATFKGVDCRVSDDGYDFEAIPLSFDFKLGFNSPTHNINCQNQENQGEPFEGEEYPRGISVTKNKASIAQITMHLDHPFYSDVEHEPALYFDQFAARLVGKEAGYVLTMDDLVGVDPTAFTDAAGEHLPWRVCDGSALPNQEQRGFEVGSVPVDPLGSAAEALRDYADYVHYVQSTQGHLNGGEGLCFIERDYPSPP